jgi:hypothetical protein
MARISLTTQAVTEAGVSAAFTATTSDGEIVDVGDGLTLVVRNGSGGSVTVTVQTPGTHYGLAIPEVALAVAAGGCGFIALNPRLFRQTAGADAGRAYVNVTGFAATVTAAVIQR